MSNDSIDQFALDLTQSGVLDETVIRQIQSNELTDPTQMISQLVEKNHLTEYQGEVINEKGCRSLVIKDYIITDRIGAGGMGLVYKAVHRILKREVALKVMSQTNMVGSDTQASSLRDRFYREMEAAARLNHPNVVTTYDAGEVNDAPFMAMEFVEGSDLSDVVKSNGPLPCQQAIDCIRQAAEGLRYAHENGIVHRDVKPANMMLSTDLVVKIMDLGLARLSDAVDTDETQLNLTSSGLSMGTVPYMAPEQARNAKRADHRADIYSLGCSLYFLLTGKLPFTGETPMDLHMAKLENSPPIIADDVPDAPPALQAVFEKMVAVDPNNRFQDMASVDRALMSVVDPSFVDTSANAPVDLDATMTATQFQSAQQSQVPQPKSRLPLIGGIVVAVVAALVVGVILLGGGDESASDSSGDVGTAIKPKAKASNGPPNKPVKSAGKPRRIEPTVHSSLEELFLLQADEQVVFEDDFQDIEGWVDQSTNSSNELQLNNGVLRVAMSHSFSLSQKIDTVDMQTHDLIAYLRWRPATKNTNCYLMLNLKQRENHGVSMAYYNTGTREYQCFMRSDLNADALRASSFQRPTPKFREYLNAVGNGWRNERIVVQRESETDASILYERLLDTGWETVVTIKEAMAVENTSNKKVKIDPQTWRWPAWAISELSFYIRGNDATVELDAVLVSRIARE